MRYKVGDRVQVQGLWTIRDGTYRVIKSVDPYNERHYLVVTDQRGGIWLTDSQLYCPATRYDREVL